MAAFSLPFTVVAAISVLVVIGMAATAAARAETEAISPPCAVSSPPSSSSRRVKRGGEYSASYGRPRSHCSDRRKLLRQQALIGNLKILNTTILYPITELIAPDALEPKPPPHEQHVWAMALSPPPDDSLFFIMSDRIYKRRLDGASLNEKVTAIAGPWYNTINVSSAIGMAMENPELTGSGSGRILHVSDCGNFILRALDLNGTELFSRNYSEALDSSVCLRTLAIDKARRVLYAASYYAIYRMNLTTSGTPSYYPPLEHWIGPRRNVSGFRDGLDPLEVLFGRPFISSHAISEDGQLIYVGDGENNCVECRVRIRVASGAVDTIAGSNVTTSGSEDGPALNASFNGPVGLALTRDGCNLFVAEIRGVSVNEYGSQDFVGRLRLIELNSRGDALVVKTVAELLYPHDYHILLSLALSPDEGKLYIGRGDMQIMEVGVHKAALFSCHATGGARSEGGVRSQATLMIIVCAVTATVVLSLVGAFIVIRCRRGPQRVRRPYWMRLSGNAVTEESVKATSTEMTPSGSGDGYSSGRLMRPSSALKQYSWDELAKACDGFSPSRLVGKGGAAEVFRGDLAGGQRVAIKMMKGAEFSESRFRQFQAELDVLGTLRHMHLCSIIGYAAHESKSFIVYPFVEGGTLYDCLQGSPGEPHIGDGTAALEHRPLGWGARLSIARQVAKALRYLHEEVDPPVIHRDVKSKNVLLEYGGHGDSVKIRAYLSDFGLAKLGQSTFGGTAPLLEGALPAAGDIINTDLTKFKGTEYSVTVTCSGDTIHTLNVAGTMGYMAPEYMRSCWLTYKNDVYAFGVILLELVTGRKAFGRMDILPGQQQDGKDGTKGIPESLTYWAKRTLRSLECLSASDEEEGRRAYIRTGGASTSPLRSKPSTNRAYSIKSDRLQQLADPQLESNGGFEWREMAAVLKLAMECVRTNPNRRPKMGEVLERLNRVQDGR